ncbi:MAG: hypothetical protein IRZ21_00550 [Thermoleophilaceae bacterium]|nr:hypothetical protein [Thermoleophilaceae bacterium]
MLPLAHAGHVLVDLPIFLGPVAVLAAWLAFMRRRDARMDACEQAEGEHEPPCQRGGVPGGV